MSTDEIKATLRQLHDELDQGKPVDPEIKDLLRLLETDIHTVLDQPAAPPSVEPAVTSRIDTMALQIEADHPTLAPVLRQVGEALSRMGL